MSKKICKCGHPKHWHDERFSLLRMNRKLFHGSINSCCALRACRCIRFVPEEK